MLYEVITRKGQIVQSFKLPRASFAAFMDNRLDSRGLLSFSNLKLYHWEHWKEFQKSKKISNIQAVKERRFSYGLRPRIYTFLNNRAGFFKHKGVLEVNADYRLWAGARLSAGYELVLFNQYDELIS